MSEQFNKQSSSGSVKKPSTEKKKLGNLASRFIVAIVAIPILLVAIYQSHHEITWLLVFSVGVIALDEFSTMVTPQEKAGRSRDRFGPLGIGAGLVAAFYWLPLVLDPSSHPPSLILLSMMAGAFIIPAIYFLFRHGDIETVAARLMATTVGIFYVGISFTFLAMLKRDHPGDIGSHLIILVLASAWLSDTGGYFAGKALGRHKLYPAVSPNKTWEGSIGGLVAVALGAAAIKMFLIPSFSWVDIMLLAIPSAAIGQVGDLCESLLKRSMGVKDSGSLLPGHGGILDRVDAVLFIAPYVYLYTAFAIQSL